MSQLLPVVAWTYAIYFVITGIWPIVSVRSFMALTGPKTDIWLVRTVGLLVTAIGLTVACAAAQHSFTSPIVILAISSSLALFCIDNIYVFKGVIARIYLLDAVAQAILIVAWLVAWFA
jgi:hypothetical protein